MTKAPLFRVAKGREVHLLIGNRSPWPQSMHLHGHYARVIGRLDATARIDAHRDTVLLDPRERLTLAFVADNPGRWMLAAEHSGAPEHRHGHLVRGGVRKRVVMAACPRS